MRWCRQRRGSAGNAGAADANAEAPVALEVAAGMPPIRPGALESEEVKGAGVVAAACASVAPEVSLLANEALAGWQLVQLTTCYVGR